MDKSNEAEDSKIFDRLCRLVSKVKAMRPPHDRRRLLIVEADLKALRATLADRSKALDAKMNASQAQVHAVTAYARCASLMRGAFHSNANSKTSESCR